MKTPHALRAGTAVVAVLACLAALSSPASATVHPYDVYMTSGTFSIGSLSVVAAVTGCTPPAVGDPRITGSIDDALTADNMTGTLSSTMLFNLPAMPPFFTGGNYAFSATGTATGTNAGDYSSATGLFSQLAFTSVAYTIKTVNGCVPTTTVVCSGNLSLTLAGGLYNGATLPLSSSEQLYANGSGIVLTRNTPCTLPFNLFITVGTPVTLGPVGTLPGAIFHQ